MLLDSRVTETAYINYKLQTPKLLKNNIYINIRGLKNKTLINQSMTARTKVISLLKYRELSVLKNSKKKLNFYK